MKRFFRRLWFSAVPTYRRIEVLYTTYQHADELMKKNAERIPANRWRLAREEDKNRNFDMVFIERRERITE